MHSDSLAKIFAISQCDADEIEMRRLVAIYRADFKKRQVTGCIFWTGSFFAYLLEGTSKQLARTVAQLSTSSRQSSPRVVLQGKVTARQFSRSLLPFVPVADFEDSVSDAYGSGCTDAARVLVAMLTEEALSNPQASFADASVQPSPPANGTGPD